MTTTIGNNTGSVQLTTVHSTSVAILPEPSTIGGTSYHFMRARLITFNVEALKPNTQYYPFFNDVDVSAYCTTASQPVFNGGAIAAAYQPLITNSLGNLVGNFYMPSGTFACGQHQFKLVDNRVDVGGGYRPDPRYGSAEAVFEAHGILKNSSTAVTTTLRPSVSAAAGTTSSPLSSAAALTGNSPGTLPTLASAAPSLLAAKPVTPVVTPINPASPAAIIATAHPLQEEWYFLYKITSTKPTYTDAKYTPGSNLGQYPISIESRSSTPPGLTSANLAVNAGAAIAYGELIPGYGADINQTATYSGVTTRVENGVTIYVHHYIIANNTAGLEFEFKHIGPPVTDPTTQLPSLTNFRPPGLGSDAVVTIVSGWRKKSTPATVSPKQISAAVQGNIQNFPVIASTPDPIAQSFYVDGHKHPDGFFITQIKVYFRTVDQSCPVILQLREMVNGHPGSQVLPHGMVVVDGHVCHASTTGTVPVSFVFDSPVYLRPSHDYCFVLKSTSMGYNVWTSRVGEKDVLTNRIIDAQPFPGVLFKSENDQTWTPAPLEDIKFELFKASFVTTTSGKLVFRPKYDSVIDNYTSTAQDLPLSYMTTVFNSTKVIVHIPMHGCSDNDYIFITGIGDTLTSSLGYNGIPASYFNGLKQIRYVDADNVYFNTSGVTASCSGPLHVTDLPHFLHTSTPITHGLGAMADKSAQLSTPYVSPPVHSALSGLVSQTAQGTVGQAAAGLASAQAAASASQIGKISVAISNSTLPGINSVTGAISGAAAAISQPLAAVLTSTSNFKVYCNIPFNEVMIDYVGTDFTDHTDILESVYATTGKSEAGNETPYTSPALIGLTDRRNFHIFNEPRLLATPKNETIHNASWGIKKSFQANVSLTSTNKDVTPIVSADGASALLRLYKIDDQSNELATLTAITINDPTYNSEIKPGNGKAAAKYKSTINHLAHPYNHIAVTVIANCPSPAYIDCYVRMSSDEHTHEDHDWTWAPINGVFGTKFTNSPNNKTHDEWTYVCTGANTGTVPVTAIAGTGGQFTCSAASLIVGDRITITGSNFTSIGGYTSGTTYKVSAITGTTPNVTGFTLQTLAGTPVSTVNGGSLTNLTFISSVGTFTVFDVKLVMRTTNNSVVPKIYGIRAVAENV